MGVLDRVLGFLGKDNDDLEATQSAGRQRFGGVADPLGRIVTAPVHVLAGAHRALSAHVAVALDLQLDQEGGSVQEQHVALPLTRVVVRLGVDRTRHGPDSRSSHS